jgi:16S rRNA (cytosine967-C5)-methyltransferase
MKTTTQRQPPTQFGKRPANPSNKVAVPREKRHDGRKDFKHEGPPRDPMSIPQRRGGEQLITPYLVAYRALTQAMNDMHGFSAPADKTLGLVLRTHRKLSARERNLVAECAYSWLRKLRSFGERYPSNAARRWALAALLEYGGLPYDTVANLASSGDKAWLRERVEFLKDASLTNQHHDLPDWLREKLAAQGDNVPALAAALNTPAPMDLRVNPHTAERDPSVAQLQLENFKAEATPHSPIGIRVLGRPNINQHDMFQSGKLEVQDEGSQLISFLVAPKRGEMVADFCAGAGGKTLLLGALMSNTGRLYAFDVEQRKLNALTPRLARSGLSNVQPVLMDNERDQRVKRLAGKMDRVLVDAPCSGLGTLRRNPDLKWRQSPESVAEMTVKQASILQAASGLVKVGGRLVYATCSILDEENEGIVAAFLAANPLFERLDTVAVLAQAKISIAGVTADALALNPAEHGCDGFFAVAMQRKAA